MYTDKEIKKIANNLDDCDIVYLLNEYMDIYGLKEIKGKIKDKKCIIKLKIKRKLN